MVGRAKARCLLWRTRGNTFRRAGAFQMKFGKTKERTNGIVPKRARDLMSPGTVMALATASTRAEPNMEPMQQCWWYNENTMVIGDLFTDMTKASIQENGRVSFTV